MNQKPIVHFSTDGAHPYCGDPVKDPVVVSPGAEERVTCEVCQTKMARTGHDTVSGPTHVTRKGDAS